MKRWLAALLIFCGLTFLLTYPAPLKMGYAVPGLGDPLLNSWILAWDCHQLLHNPLKLFEANSFFPQPHSLAYSEHLFASALMVLPVYLLSDNAILSYNFIQFFSFVLCALGMYLLVDYLTGNWWAALLAGIIFAFCPYKFGQIWHLQMLTAQWIPFTFLFLHKFTRSYRWRDLGFFILFLILQILSSTYYALFLIFAVGLYIIFIFLLRVGKGVIPFMKKIAISAVIVLLIVGPFFIPYYKISKEMGFKRNLQDVEIYSPDILSYLVITPWHKVFYIKYLKQFRPYGKGGEAILFPGGLVLLLALLSYGKIRASLKKNIREDISSKYKIVSYLPLIAKSVWLGSFLLIIFFMILSRYLPKFVSLLILLSIFFISWFILLYLKSHLSAESISKEKGLSLSNKDFFHFYMLLGSLGFFISLGPNIHLKGKILGKGPFILLHRFLPGFKALRVSGRIGIMVMLSLAVMAGFGACWLLNLAKKKSRYLMSGIGFVLAAILCYEYTVFPLSLKEIPRKTPQIYRWLAQQEADFGIIEFPLYRQWHLEAQYLYWSTKHWKNIVNGYGAFIPPHFWLLKHRFPNFPSADYLELLKQYCPVKYIIIHLNKFPSSWITGFPEWLNSPQFPSSLKLKTQLDNDYIFELINGGRGFKMERRFPDWMLQGKRLSFFARALEEDFISNQRLIIYLNDTLLATFRLDTRLRYYQHYIPSQEIKPGVNILVIHAIARKERDSAAKKLLFRLDRLVLSD